MVLTGSARARKSQLKKEGKSREEIDDYLLTHGFVQPKQTPIEKQQQLTVPISNPPVATTPPMNPSAGIGGTTSLEDTIKAVALQQMLSNPDPRWATLLLSLLEKTNTLKQAETITKVVKYKRPAFLNPKQNEIIDAVLDPKYKIIMIEGDQRTGKTTLLWVAVTEMIVNADPGKLQIDLMAGKGEQAERILRDMNRDILLADVNKECISTLTNSKAVWWNGSQLNTHETTVSDIKGSDGNIIWIEELDCAVKQSPEAVMSALFVLRARKAGSLKIIMSANRDKGVYMMLRDVLKQQSLSTEDVGFFTLTKADSPHLAMAGNDALLGAVSDAICGKDFTARRLENKDLGTGDKFNPITLKDLMKEFEFYITQIKPNQHTDAILSIDPSGTGHPFGYFAGGLQDNQWYEIDAGEFQMGDGRDGISLTPDHINEKLWQICRVHNIKRVCLESNTYGSALEIFFRAKGLRVTMNNYGGDNDTNSRESQISVARAMTDDHAVLFHSELLHSSLIMYDPENAKKAGKFKGDIADAFIHFCWEAGRGLSYFRTEPSQSYSFVKSEQSYDQNN